MVKILNTRNLVTFGVLLVLSMLAWMAFGDLSGQIKTLQGPSDREILVNIQKPDHQLLLTKEVNSNYAFTVNDEKMIYGKDFHFFGTDQSGPFFPRLQRKLRNGDLVTISFDAPELYLRAERTYEVTEGSRQNLKLDLAPYPGAITGITVDESGQVLPNSPVTLHDWEETVNLESKSDSSGKFVFNNLDMQKRYLLETEFKSMWVEHPRQTQRIPARSINFNLRIGGTNIDFRMEGSNINVRSENHGKIRGSRSSTSVIVR